METVFDKIYIIHLAEAHDRYSNIVKTLDNFSIPYSIWWTCRKKISYEFADGIKSLHTPYYDCVASNENKNVYGNVYNVALEHYNVIKTSYDRGMESILIMEDDFNLKDDIQYEEMKMMFNNLPNDWDIIKYDSTQFNFLLDFTKENRGNDLFINCPYLTLGAYCYALNRKAMKYIIDEYNIKFRAADLVLEDAIQSNKLKCYAAQYRIGSLTDVESTIV